MSSKLLAVITRYGFASSAPARYRCADCSGNRMALLLGEKPITNDNLCPGGSGIILGLATVRFARDTVWLPGVRVHGAGYVFQPTSTGRHSHPGIQ